MVSRASIPKSSTGLKAADYFAYLRPAGRADPHVEIGNVWRDRLPSRRLYPVPTGRHALWYFLEVAELRPGDEVLVAAYNFYVIVRLVVQKGLIPIFVDIEPDTLCIDPADLERKITPRTRLVIVTHMFGHPADLSRIAKICIENELILFEDCAHAVGTLHAGTQVGQAGDGALFSFGVEKIINSFGGGLMALTGSLAPGYRFVPTSTRWLAARLDTFVRFCVTLHNAPSVHRWTAGPARFLLGRVLRSPRLAQALSPSRDDPDYRFDVNSRAPLRPFMVRMQALQLGRLEANIARRRALVRRMTARLSLLPQVRCLDADRHGRSNGAYFGIAVPDPARLAEHLGRRGIASSVEEFLDCSGLKQFEQYKARCPEARRASATILRLPSYPGLSDRQADDIAAAIERFFLDMPSECEGG